MVTRDQIWDQLGKRPFQPFRLTMLTGEFIEIFRRNQAVVTPRQVIYADAEDHMHWVELSKLDRLEIY